MDSSAIRANLLDSYLKLAKGKKGIIYSISRKHSDHICTEYRNAGINIVRIDSETPRDERRLYVKRFKDGLIDIIVNVDIFSEGFDCPDIEFIQLARPTKSLVKYLQQVGRGLRPVSGKGKCLILDNVGAHIEFGLPNADREWETEFVGVKQIRKKRNANKEVVDIGKREQSFNEGDDDLLLIEDVDGIDIPKTNIDKYCWKLSDDELLKTLYIDRKCSEEIIAAVFNMDIEDINARIIELKLNQ